MVSEMAKAPVPAMIAANPAQFANFMRKMSTLPRKADDKVTGEERVKTFTRMLGDRSADELGFLTHAALSTCHWHPTIAECLDILKGWKRNDEPMQAHLLAGTLSRREMQARFDEAMTRLARRDMTQDQIDALPSRIKEMAEARMLLWRCVDCGGYVARPLPVMAMEAAA